MEQNIEGKVVVITGESSGIGEVDWITLHPFPLPHPFLVSPSSLQLLISVPLRLYPTTDTIKRACKPNWQPTHSPRPVPDCQVYATKWQFKIIILFIMLRDPSLPETNFLLRKAEEFQIGLRLALYLFQRESKLVSMFSKSLCSNGLGQAVL